MNRLQKSFYERDFKPGFLIADPVDIEGQEGYVQVLFHEIVNSLHDDPSTTSDIRRLAETYEGRGGFVFTRELVADTYFLDGDWAAGFEKIGSRLPIQTYLTLAETLGHPRLTEMTVFRWSETHITKRGIAGLGDIFDRLRASLDEFHDANGMSVIEEFWARLSRNASVEEVARSVEDEVVARFSGSEVRRLLTLAREELTREAGVAFRMYPDAERPVAWPAPWVHVSAPLGSLLFAKVHHLMRAAENSYREAAGVPLVGQGWVSEATLYRELQEAFPGERIVPQARPMWLRPQSIDIYFPDHAIGVEYQGKQHTTPVEFFGGAKAFEAQQERDWRKRMLFDENGCVLVEVHPSYVLQDVIDTVVAAMSPEGPARVAASRESE